MKPGLGKWLALLGYLVGSAVLYFTFIYQLGFPDGFISELGRRQRARAWGVIAAGLMVMLAPWLRGRQSGHWQGLLALAVAAALLYLLLPMA